VGVLVTTHNAVPCQWVCSLIFRYVLGSMWVLQRLLALHVGVSKLLTFGHYLQHFQLPSVLTRVSRHTIRNNNR
jgi:hypothetical protein